MVQNAKQSYWYKIQSDILNECCHGQSEIWKTIGKVGITSKENIPMEVILHDGSVSYDNQDVLRKRKNSFCDLFDGRTNASVSESLNEEPNCDIGSPYSIT